MKNNEAKSAASLITPRELDGNTLIRMLSFAREGLMSRRDEINRLNVFPVPDGDTGDNMSLTVEGGFKAISSLRDRPVGEVANELARGMLLSARGNSGVILSQLFAGVASALNGSVTTDAQALALAFGEGARRAYAAVLEPTEGTILTVAKESAEYAKERITSESTPLSFFTDMKDKAQESLRSTPTLLPTLREAGVVDSGGRGLVCIFESFTDALGTAKLHKPSLSDATEIKTENGQSGRYCTELLIRLDGNIDGDSLRKRLSSLGNSVVTAVVDSILKVHVHTDEPSAAVNLCLSYGSLISLKIENMREQERKNRENGHTRAENSTADTPRAASRYGVVTVLSGEGMKSIFRALGADIIVSTDGKGAPSVEELIDALGRLDREHIFILPNSSNVRMTAEQAARMYGGNVTVIPTANAGEGYAAMSVYDTELSQEELTDRMLTELAVTRTAYTSVAVRPLTLEGVRVTPGDTVGITDKRVALSLPKREDAALALSDILLSDKDTLTVFTGKDIKSRERLSLEKNLGKRHPDREIYVLDGGQDVYTHLMISG